MKFTKYSFYTIIAALIYLCIKELILWKPNDNSFVSWNSESSKYNSFFEFKQFYELKYNQTTPKGFDKWYQFAKQHKCKLEHVYDPIYEDLSPFFGMSSQEFQHRMKLASSAKKIERIIIKNGVANKNKIHFKNVRWITVFM